MNNPEIINICYACDENYARYMAISMMSIERYTTTPIHFYVLHSDITLNSQKIIKEALSSEITFIQVNIEEFSGFSLTIPSITITTYFRLNIAQYLSSVEKVIYIDVDTIITNDITALWNTPLHNKSIAAVYDHLLELVQGGGITHIKIR